MKTTTPRPSPPADVGRALSSLAAALLLLACHPQRAATSPPPPQEPPPEPRAEQVATEGAPFETFPTAREAFEALLSREPSVEVIALGEYHQTKGAPEVASSLRRFSQELLPSLKGKASDLVIETFVPAEGCLKQSKEVASEVQRDTRRPDSTEAEIIEMIERARANAIRPHILEMGCDDYDRVFSEGEVDYDQMLRVLTRLLREKAIQLRDLRARSAGRRPSTVILYGGNLHNDLYPEEEVRGYSFGPDLDQALVGYYLEVDLFVPELIEGDRHLKRQAWYPAFLEHQSTDHALLLERGPKSYVLVFRRSPGEPRTQLKATRAH